jgi:hypothetical protein
MEGMELNTIMVITSRCIHKGARNFRLKENIDSRVYCKLCGHFLSSINYMDCEDCWLLVTLCNFLFKV